MPAHVFFEKTVLQRKFGDPRLQVAHLLAQAFNLTRGRLAPGVAGEDGIAELCHRAGIAESFYYSGSKAFLEVGKKRLADFYAAVDRSTNHAPKRALPSMLAA